MLSYVLVRVALERPSRIYVYAVGYRVGVLLGARYVGFFRKNVFFVRVMLYCMVC